MRRQHRSSRRVVSKFGNCLICPREILMGGKVFSIKKFLPLCSLPSSTYILTYVRTYVVVHRPIASSCWSDWSAVAAAGSIVARIRGGEARGFKATGLACLAHQSPGIKCEQSCSSSPHPALILVPPKVGTRFFGLCYRRFVSFRRTTMTPTCSQF